MDRPEITMRRYAGGAHPELAPIDAPVAGIVVDAATLEFLIRTLPKQDVFRDYLVDLRERAIAEAWRSAA